MAFPHRLVVVSLAAGLLSAACAGEQHTDRRDEIVDLPSSYDEYDVEGVETDAWCSDFGRESLDRVVRQTWDENLELKAAWARLQQAEAQAAQTRASLWPQLQAEAGVTASNESERLPESLSEGGDAGVDTSFESSLAASYEVDIWGKFRERARAAKLEARAVERSAQSLAMTLTSQVAEAWLDVVAARARIDLLEQQIETSEEFLELTNMRFRDGRAQELDITQQRQSLEALRGQMVEARLQSATARHRLAVLTGGEPGEEVEVESATLPEPPALPDPGVPADLLERRPDLQQALFRLRAADRRTAAAVADKLPTLQLSASLFLQAEQIGRLLDQLIWSASAVAGQSIFQGGRLEAAQREAESVAEERLYVYGQTLLEALQDVRDALVGSKYQADRIASLRREYDSADSALEAARSRYREGTVDYFRVLDAFQQRQQLERDLLEARRQRLSYRISLCRAIGGSWATDLESSIASDDDSESSDDGAE